METNYTLPPNINNSEQQIALTSPINSRTNSINEYSAVNQYAKKHPEACLENFSVMQTSVDDREISSCFAGTVVSTEKTVKQKSKKYKCTFALCSKVFEKPSKLLRHSSVHSTDKRPFACLKCPQKFSTHSSLKRHDIMHSELVAQSSFGETVEKTHFCIICSKEFSTHEAVTSHLKTHKEELKNMEFTCQYCQQTFGSITEMNQHSKQHIENKSHKCLICNKFFSKGII